MGIIGFFEKNVAKNISSDLEKTNKTSSSNFMKINQSILSKEDSIFEAVELFVIDNADVIIISRNKNIEGILRKRDIIFDQSLFSYESMQKRKIKEIMSKKMSLCKKEDTLEKLCAAMLEKDIDTLVVKNASSPAIISIIDVLSAIANFSFKIENPPILESAMEENINFLDCNSNLNTLIESMKKTKVEYAIITKNKQPIGIATIKDLLSAIRRGLDFNKTTVHNICSPSLVSLNPGDSLNNALEIILQKRFNQIPLTLKSDIIGIVTIKSLLKAYYRFISDLKNDVKGNYFNELVREIWKE